LKEKDFINKVHKKLSNDVYKWKINDPYHGGVPDAFYSGPKGFCFVEYKYKETLPKKSNSKIKINLSEQQRIWINRAQDHKLPAYIVFASKDQVCLLTNPNLPSICVGGFNRMAQSFDNYIAFLEKICLK
jgi:hypothetical protein